MPTALVVFMIFYQRRIHAHRQAQAAQEAQHQRDKLLVKLEAEESTRKRIASDLHDNIGQVMSLAALTLSTVDVNQPEKATSKVETVYSLITRSIHELRQLARLISASEILHGGLQQAIAKELEWVRDSKVLAVRYDSPASPPPEISHEQAILLFRSFQELLGNAIKHAQASVINVQLHHTAQQLAIYVEDNGVGFYPSTNTSSGGMGLTSIHERMSQLEGEFTIHSTPGSGTYACLKCPIH
ncbi:Histidine kinase-, DNA gyrase B-, and HSP90-like ATPase [Parapedobacter koreensis]|uniref:Oxygen sensor histidine kinase NreB n=2 Tax=Parapedobacter koreensis TaxID=332977 RepID=A0A1H7SX52_9SPHI|nr:Histidine kinase-, DNA gyrase B-, and HSP90-like ATPase [Parapedobacter koreensis]